MAAKQMPNVNIGAGMPNINIGKILLPPGTLTSPREVARHVLFAMLKLWRMGIRNKIFVDPEIAQELKELAALMGIRIRLRPATLEPPYIYFRAVDETTLKIIISTGDIEISWSFPREMILDILYQEAFEIITKKKRKEIIEDEVPEEAEVIQPEEIPQEAEEVQESEEISEDYEDMWDIAEDAAELMLEEESEDDDLD